MLREQSLGFCNAAGNIQGRDSGMAWMSQLSRWSPKLRKKRTHRALDTFSSRWEKRTHERPMVPAGHVSSTCQGPFDQAASFICFMNLCLDVAWKYVSHLGKRFFRKLSLTEILSAIFGFYCNICIGYQVSHFSAQAVPNLSLDISQRDINYLMMM